jgi:hypothetical protein
VRSAAILRLLDGGDFDYIAISYYALNNDEYESMSPAIQGLYRQQVRGMVGGNLDLFCRAWRAFDEKAQGLSKIQITDTGTILTRVRQIIVSEVLGKKAPTSGAKKVNTANSTRLAGRTHA